MTSYYDVVVNKEINKDTAWYYRWHKTSGSGDTRTALYRLLARSDD